MSFTGDDHDFVNVREWRQPLERVDQERVACPEQI
jgi:hypothetical protein